MIRPLASVALLFILTSPAWGNSAGIAGRSGKQGANTTCTGCHSRGVAPTVSFTGPVGLAPGALGDFSFTVRSNEPFVQTAAGFNVAASAGTLQVIAGQFAKLLSGELVHTSPRFNDNDSFTWAFRWRAPAAAGNYTLFGAGNSVNDDGTTDGDKSATTTLVIVVGDVTPIPTATTTVGATASPTRTATATPTTTAIPTASPSATPTPSHTFTVVPSATPSSTRTPTATGVQPGDANCDHRINAADLSSFQLQFPGGVPGSCGADVNGNGTLDPEDLALIVEFTFR